MISAEEIFLDLCKMQITVLEESATGDYYYKLHCEHHRRTQEFADMMLYQNRRN